MWSRNFHLCSTQKLNIVFTHAYHWTVSWVRWILFVFWHNISFRSISILSFQSHLGITSGHFLPSLLTNITYAFVILKTHNKMSEYTNILLHNVWWQTKLALLYYTTAIVVTNTIRNTGQCLVPYITTVKLFLL